MEVLIWAVPLLVLLCYLYWYFQQKYSYWKRLGIPYVPAMPPFGSQNDLFLRPGNEIEIERYKKYGRLYGSYDLTKPSITVGDPELLKNILVKDFQFFPNRRYSSVGDPIADNMVTDLRAEDWKRVRNIITPTFTTGKIKKMTSVISDSTKTLIENFKTHAKNGKPVDVKRLFGAFSMDVIASTAFATKVDSHNDPDNKFVAMAKKAFGPVFQIKFILHALFPKIFEFFKIPVFLSDVNVFFKDITLNIIKERKRTGQVGNDFLQLLMEAQNEAEKETKAVNGTESDTSKGQKGLSNDELVAQCVIFFIAGYETTATTLSIIAYFLALNPDCQERLISEIDKALADNKGVVSYEVAQGIKYLDNVITETLRIHSPAVRFEREAAADYQLGDTGIVIPKGMIVGIPVHAMHHDPEFYPDPEKFDPDRFSAESKGERSPYVYLPFGSGPRNCIGMRFALMEMKICLVHLFSQFRVKVCPQTDIPLQYKIGVALVQTKDITLQFELRSEKD